VSYFVIDCVHWVLCLYHFSRKNTKMVRGLWWRGLPASIRGQVWKLAAANDLNVTSGNNNIELCFAVITVL